MGAIKLVTVKKKQKSRKLIDTKWAFLGNLANGECSCKLEYLSTQQHKPEFTTCGFVFEETKPSEFKNASLFLITVIVCLHHITH